MSAIRPIDAEMLLCDIDDYFDRLIKKEVFSKGAIAGIKETMQEIVENTPTLDYTPVIHAKWELTTIFPSGIREYKCSKCGRKLSFFPADGTFHTIKEKLREYPYCNCGAEMVLRDDGDV